MTRMTWSADSVVTLIAAVIAASAAVVAAVMSSISTRRATRNADRQEWWRRLSWVMDNAVSDNSMRVRLALTTIASMVEAPWAADEDNALALAVASTIVRTPRGGESRV